MRRIALVFFTLTGAALVWAQQAGSSDPLLQAMKDELERSKKMALPNLDPPYFVQFLVDESTNFSVSASLGGLLSRRVETVRSPEVKLRVGDYKFDNTNYTGAGFNFGARYDLERFPLQDRYDVLRRHLWLQSDSAYKSAIEALSRKHAALRNISQTDSINDFAKAPVLKRIEPLPGLKLDQDLWTNRVREISGLFARYPAVKNSGVEFESSAGGYTIVNSEGTEVREPETVTFMRIRAISQADDGMTMRDSVTFHALDPATLPDVKTVDTAVRTLAENVTALAKAPKGEDYSGPVLFEGMAGAQIFAEVLGKNFALPRRPVSEGGRGGGFTPSELEGRIGARVLPDSFDVVDDPTQTEWKGQRLFGHYTVDREGVAASPLKLVEKGVLKGYLLTRQPLRGFEGSNGHARMPGNFGASTAGISNLFVHTTNAVPVAELKKKLLELIQVRSKPYGIIVRKMDFPSVASIDEVRRLLQGNQGGRPVSLPLLAYKVYPDGREELIRAVRFRGLNARSLKDILASGDDEAAFEFMDNPAPFALAGASGFSTEAAVIAPSILVDDLELHPLEDELPKLPVVPPPTLSVK